MHLNKTNGKIYIGQTKKSYCARWNNGKGYGRCTRFATAIKKYGWNGFEHIPLIEGLSKIEADYFERFFIEFFNSQNPEFGYNSTAGGDENPMDNLAIKEKHHEIMKKVYVDTEYQKKHREAVCKKIRCVETKIVYGSLREAAIGVNLKSRSAICMCCRGKRKTAGGYHWEYVDEELKNKYKYVPHARKRKQVLCVETDVIYLSLACAVSFAGVTMSAISACCHGRRKTAGGYHWEYV